MDPDPGRQRQPAQAEHTQQPSKMARAGGDRAPAQSGAQHRPRAQLPQDFKARYSAFYREYVPRLVAYATQLGASHVQAADIVQDVLIGMLKTFDNYKHPYAIARIEVRRAYFHLVFDAREEPSDELEGKGQPLITDPRAFEELEEKFWYLPLLPLLPPKQRIVMALTLDGASPAEIANDLSGGITAVQVRSNLLNARRRLQELIKQTEREQEVSE